MLGVIIGIASVITIVSLGSGAQSLITNSITNFGTNIIAVIPGNSDGDGAPPAIARGIIITSLKRKDAEDINKIPEVEYILPIVIANAITTYKNFSENISMYGVGEKYPLVHEFEVEQGRFFTQHEIDNFTKVVVLGVDVAKKIFGVENPIGKNIKIDQKNFKIIGVLEEIGTVFFINQDNQIYIPYTTAQKQILGIDYLHVLRLKARSAIAIPLIKTEIKKIIRRNHSITNPKNDDFEIRTQEQALNVLSSITQALKLFLATIAGISLLVGGVGIMNMMLVVVTSRTKEIGLRKALGAKKRDIIFQFLMESTTITLIGGFIGIFIGISLSWGVFIIMQKLEYDWNFIISIPTIILACSLSIAIGITFGLYPSIKAAKLNPIDALRYE